VSVNNAGHVHRSYMRTNSSSSHITACTITAASASSRKQARPHTAAIRAPILCSLKLDEVPASVGGMEGGGGMGPVRLHLRPAVVGAQKASALAPQALAAPSLCPPTVGHLLLAAGCWLHHLLQAAPPPCPHVQHATQALSTGSLRGRGGGHATYRWPPLPPGT